MGRTSTFVCVSVLLFVCACAEDTASVNPSSTDAVAIDDNAMGMSVLYKLVHYFLGDIVHTEKITDSFLNLTTVFVDGEFDTDALYDWKSWLNYLTGFAVCLGIGLVYIVVVPLVGFFLCCCRCCCGKCGGKRREMDSKRAPCKRRTYCFLLIIFNTLVLAGVVCGFVCNTLIHKNLQNDDGKGAIGSIKTGLNTLGNYMNTSFDDLSKLVLDEFDLTSDKIFKDINETSNNAVDDALKKIKVTELIEKADMVAREANSTKIQLDAVKTKLDLLQTDSLALQQNLSSIKQDISAVCTPASNVSKCPGFDPSQYDVDADFSSLQDLQTQTDAISQSLGLSDDLDKVKTNIDKAKTEVKDKTKQEVDEASNAITDISDFVADQVSKLKGQKDEFVEFIPETYKSLDDANEDVRKYSNYVFYAGLGVCCLYLLIVILYYFGVLFGLCGERPGEGAPCCHTGRGANLLMGGVALTFLFSWLFMLLCVVLFSLGGPMYTEVCRYFINHQPQDVRFLDDALQNGLKIGDFYNTTDLDDIPTISGTLQNCLNNQSLYTALSLNNIVDLNTTLNIDDVHKEINKLKDIDINIPPVIVMNDDIKTKLNEFANAGLENIDFNSYFTELSKQLTKESLEELAEVLDTISPSMSDSDKDILQANARKLRDLNTGSIPRMKANANALNTSLTDIQRSSQLKDAVLNLTTSLDQVASDWNSQQSDLIKDALVSLANSIIRRSTQSVNRIINEISNNQPKCRQLVSAFYSLTDSACVLGLDPLNGLWFSFGWCLILLLPTLVFAILLADQYRCELEYDEKDFDEPNYQMYGGHSGDTIPLTSMERSGNARDSRPAPYPTHHGGHQNSGYSPDRKLANAPPPAYEDHMRQNQGRGRYETTAGRHHDLSANFPAQHSQHPPHAYGNKHAQAYPY